ncbi:MAG: DNA translocase FtsK 4TM domain-containing protein, partial [Caldilineales bacterium]|nr:DNA translocase FtsK 4TM domain-containing protein [Caldilineales bacterium]
MAKRKGRGRKPQPPSSPSPLTALLKSQVWGTLLAMLGVFTFLALISPRQGAVSRQWLDLWRTAVGGGVLLLPFLMVGVGVWGVLRGAGKLNQPYGGRLVGALLLFLAIVTALHLDVRQAEEAAWSGRGGGLLGWAVSDLLLQTLGPVLSWFAVFLAALAGVALLAGPLLLALGLAIYALYHQWRDGRELRRSQEALQRATQPPPPVERSPEPSLREAVLRWWRDLRRPAAADQEEVPSLRIGGNGTPRAPAAPRVIGGTAEPPPARPVTQPTPAAAAADALFPRTVGGVQSWRLPNIADILDDAAEVEISRDEIRERARIIEQTLADFGVPVKVVEANQGPAVTQYGLQPGYRTRRKTTDEMRREAEQILKQRGYGSPRRPITEELIKQVMEEEVEKYERVKIKVSKIQALANDLALALSASPIRIEAPVPGRPLVGLEVPNVQKALVSLRSVLESDAFRQLKSPLRIALGQDTAGQPVVADLARMPHLLIAGATGSGKSVCVNAIIATLLLTHTPDTLRFLMVDPKMVELTLYNGIPHLYAPVVVELDRVVPLLSWATGEMDRRYKLFAQAGARNLEAYNEKLAKKGEPILPYIVVVIDELADLMMAAPDDVERYVCRLAQMSRATGIHLIIATQRPSVDVVTGLIKANFPARIAFAVTSQVDSRVILDAPGAEALLGRGDMLFMRPDSSKLERLQGVFVSDTELERLVRYWKGVRVTEGEGTDAAATAPGGLPPSPAPGPDNVVQTPLWDELLAGQRQALSEDDLYDDAVRVVTEAGRASVSLLQRRLKIGYSRAARLIDLLEERGVIGPDQGGT